MIIGYTFESIEAKRAEISGRVDVSSSVKIEFAREKEIEIGEKKKVVEIGFKFDVEYKPTDAKISFSGTLLYTNKNNKEIVKSWEKEKKLPEDVDIEVKNFLFKKCLSLALTISEEIRMPSPLPFPMIVKKKEESGYIG